MRNKLHSAPAGSSQNIFRIESRVPSSGRKAIQEFRAACARCFPAPLRGASEVVSLPGAALRLPQAIHLSRFAGGICRLRAVSKLKCAGQQDTGKYLFHATFSAVFPAHAGIQKIAARGAMMAVLHFKFDTAPTTFL